MRNRPCTYIVTLLLAGILVIAGYSCGSSSTTAQGGEATDSTAQLTVILPLPDSMKRAGDYVDARSFDTLQMGRIAEGETIEGQFRITNVSDKPLVIVQVITGCGCTTADYDPAPILAGDSRVVTYRFDSRGRFGQQFKSIEIVTAQRQCATVYLNGDVYMPEK